MKNPRSIFSWTGWRLWYEHCNSRFPREMRLLEGIVGIACISLVIALR